MTPATAAATAPAADDPYLWLEGSTDPKALDWVKAQNAFTVQAYASSPEFERTRKRILEVLDSEARIPFVRKLGDHYYNFWRDKAHPKGLWRRTTLDEYRRDAPAWETVIDLDALAAAERENWVWHGAQCLKPAYRRCLVSLSRGGADADVVREFDLVDRAFVGDGFALPEAKSQVAWRDADHIYVGTDFGPGSMTRSGYPRIVKLWTRGTPLASAATVYEGADDDLSVTAWRDLSPGYERDFVSRAIDFFDSELYLRGGDGRLAHVDLPRDAIVDVHRQWMLVEPRSAWTLNGTRYPSGSLLAAKFDDWMAGDRQVTALFTPDDHTSLSGYTWTRRRLLLSVMDDVASRQDVLTPRPDAWQRQPLGGTPALTTIEAGGIDPDNDDSYFLTISGFLAPTTLYYGTLDHGKAKPIKRAPEFFDASRYTVRQHFAVSSDGTRVPYFVVGRKGMRRNGRNPTLLYGYGGFEVALQPSYSGSVGRAWLERGGVYVVANIRGGGEYGPRWHQAALKANRMRAYEDFAAVAADLVRRGITSREHLGIEGGSNGGLLVGNMLTHYPPLFGAAVCEVPLLDMKRYTHLAAGASWIAEYGDPDKPDEWAYLRQFSPYQNLRADVAYPPVLFTTSTRDDRVGPAHARKMAAKMLAMGKDVAFYENIEGGHG
ncbi:MAG TPA: prolyl oligopeptidase family serine peptidase, partial [Alphaproteobacteria bacterium]